MATPYSIPTIIGVANISMYLAQNAVFKSALFRKPPFRPDLPNVIYVENDSLNYLYTGTLTGSPTQQTLDELDGVANYVWSLCVYTLRAYNIYSSGNGGTVVPITPGTAMPLPYDFIVSGSSFIATGETSKVINLFQGYNIQFSWNNIVQNTTDAGDGSTFYSYDRTSGLLTLSNAVNAGDRIRIIAV